MHVDDGPPFPLRTSQKRALWAEEGASASRARLGGRVLTQRWVSSFVSVAKSCWFLVLRACPTCPTCASSGMCASGSERMMYLQRQERHDLVQNKVYSQILRAWGCNHREATLGESYYSAGCTGVASSVQWYWVYWWCMVSLTSLRWQIFTDRLQWQ